MPTVLQPPPPPDGWGSPNPLDNELLQKLDASLRDRAQKMVDEALVPALDEASRTIERAMTALLGSNAMTPTIRKQVEVDAALFIRGRAITLAYQKLAERVASELADGDTVDPN